MTAHDNELAATLDAIKGEPRTRGEQLDALTALTERDPDTAELLDHLCIQADRIVEFIDALGPALVQFSTIGEQLAASGPMGLIGMLMGGAPEAAEVEPEAIGS